jgi:hypothetical protein
MIHLTDEERRDPFKVWMAGIVERAFWVILVATVVLAVFLLFGLERSGLWVALLATGGWLEQVHLWLSFFVELPPSN